MGTKRHQRPHEDESESGERSESEAGSDSDSDGGWLQRPAKAGGKRKKSESSKPSGKRTRAATLALLKLLLRPKAVEFQSTKPAVGTHTLKPEQTSASTTFDAALDSLCGLVRELVECEAYALTATRRHTWPASRARRSCLAPCGRLASRHPMAVA